MASQRVPASRRLGARWCTFQILSPAGCRQGCGGKLLFSLLLVFRSGRTWVGMFLILGQASFRRQKCVIDAHTHARTMFCFFRVQRTICILTARAWCGLDFSNFLRFAELMGARKTMLVMWLQRRGVPSVFHALVTQDVRLGCELSRRPSNYSYKRF